MNNMCYLSKGKLRIADSSHRVAQRTGRQEQDSFTVDSRSAKRDKTLKVRPMDFQGTALRRRLLVLSQSDISVNRERQTTQKQRDTPLSRNH